MSLKQLDIHHLRNITVERLLLHPEYNFIAGDNGSGKTSILEAVYLLSTGHSFRTREISPLVQYGQEKLTVFARTILEETISIQKSKSGPTLVNINQHPCKSSSDLSRFMPCQVFYQDIFSIIDAGPSVRRSLLDWGMFHVKHEYHQLWKDYKRVLSQRNALLRQKADINKFPAWNKQLTELSVALDALREPYFQDWSSAFQSILAELTDVPVEMSYYKGWDRKRNNTPLSTILVEQFESDRQRQYTHSGAHQADILFGASIPGKAKQIYSRGQQKIMLVALKLAQAMLLNTPCLYLFDDIAAELDINHINRLFRRLTKLRGQFIFTAIDNTLLSQIDTNQDYHLFTIQQGKIEPVQDL